MKFITIRHDKSENNEVLEKTPKEYLQKRKLDPDLFAGGKERCEKLGKYLKEKNIQINKFYCSLHLRAIKTMLYISDSYDKNVPKEYLPNIYEYGGNYQEKKGYPGLNKQEINAQFPELIIPDSEDISNGWYKSENKETNEEFLERVKKVVESLKMMAKNMKGEDDKEKGEVTVCLVSHVHFLSALYTVLMGKEVEFFEGRGGGKRPKDGIIHDNLGMSSFDISKEGKISINYINDNPLK